MVESVINFFVQKFKEYQDPVRAVKMTEYMKNIQPHLGVYTPERMHVYKEFKKSIGKDFKGISHTALEEIVRELWDKREREYRYVGLFLIEYAGNLAVEQLSFIKELIIIGDWWDTTDSIAIGLVSKLLEGNKEIMTPIIKEWATDENIWVRRTSILSQLYFKEETDHVLFEYCISKTMKENEFFIQKAIGWALREYSKTNSNYVVDFIQKNRDELSKLSIREGEKHIKKMKKKSK